MKSLIGILIFLPLAAISFSQTNNSRFSPDSTNLNLGVDIYLCDGYIHLLDAGTGFDSYLWQDGSTNQTYMVTEPGSFWVHAYLGSTMYADTINIGYWPNPEPNLGNDTTLCYESSLMLEAPPGCILYLWQDGSTLPYYHVTDEGIYCVSVMDIHGCMGYDTIFIDYTTTHVDLGSDTIICDHDSILLDAGNEFLSYEWQDGSTLQYFLVDPVIFGIGYHYFSVTAIDSIGCESADSILVCISECTLNVTQSKSEQFRIYPNPANDKLNIDLKGLTDKIQSVEIINSYGNIVFQEEMPETKCSNNFRLDISNLYSGIYYLKIICDKREYLNKLLIQKL